MTDLEEDHRAIAALVHRLRADHGDVNPLAADAEPFAAEFIAALRAFGWRPVCVVPPAADWRKNKPGNDPDAYERGGQLWRKAWEERESAAAESVIPATRMGGGTETDHQGAAQ